MDVIAFILAYGEYDLIIRVTPTFTSSMQGVKNKSYIIYACMHPCKSHVFYYSYAPWCPACQHLQADWENLGRQSESLGISVGRVDVTQQPGLCLCVLGEV